MNLITLIRPGTAGGTATCDTGNYTSVMFVAGGLATIEKVTVGILLPDGSPIVPAVTMSNAVANLVAATPSGVYMGGPCYSLTLDATAGNTGLYAIFQGMPNT